MEIQLRLFHRNGMPCIGNDFQFVAGKELHLLLHSTPLLIVALSPQQQDSHRAIASVVPFSIHSRFSCKIDLITQWYLAMKVAR